MRTAPVERNSARRTMITSRRDMTIGTVGACIGVGAAYPIIRDCTRSRVVKAEALEGGQ